MPEDSGERPESQEPPLKLKEGEKLIYPLFGPDTKVYQPEDDEKLKNWDAPKYRSPLTTLHIHDRDVPFGAELMNASFSKMWVLNPFSPNLGYTIDERDYSTPERIKKIVDNYTDLQQEVGKDQGFVDLRIKTALTLGNKDIQAIIEGLTIMVETPEGKLIGKPSVDNIGMVECRRFTPLDAPPLASTRMTLEQMLQLVGKTSTTQLTIEDANMLDIIDAAPQEFLLMLPNDEQVLANTNVQFILK